MSSDEIEDLCENYLPYALNPMLSTEEVKEKLHVSDHGCTIAKILGKEDVKDIGTEHLVKYAHSLALDLLKDKDGVYDIREYFLK